MSPLKISWAAALAALAVALPSCSEQRPRGRVALIGIDGATLRIARPMIDRGELPHLARIGQQGVFGPLLSHFPLFSPRIWTSIATGKKPFKHGIAGFFWKDDDGTRFLYQSTERKTHALWNIVSAAGLSVGVVNWWNTYPPEKLNGVVVTDHVLQSQLAARHKMMGTLREGRGPSVYPPEWAERIAKLLEDERPLTDIPTPFTDPSGFPEWLRPGTLTERYRHDEAVARIGVEVDRVLRPDLLMVFLSGIDRVSHAIWGAVEPPSAYDPPLGLSPHQRRTMAHALRRYYTFTDALIGRLTEGFGPNDLVIIVSDHGFEAGRNLAFLTGVHNSPRSLHGVVFARGPGIAPPKQPREMSINDVTPTILSWLGLPVGDDMDGSPAAFLTVPPVPSIATHDTREIEFVASGPSGAEDAILEHLEALGYMEESAAVE